jgi:hypothetical protein
MEDRDTIQGTEEWKAAKRGKFSASKILDLCPGAKGYTAARENYIMDIVLQILTRETEETYCSYDMQRGTELEPEARTAYEAKTGLFVDTVGFENHPTIQRLGGSPDGEINTDGGIEIKCPQSKEHYRTLTGGEIQKKYLYQMQCNMMCTGRTWWDFVSYHPGFPEHLQVYIKRIKPDPMIFAEIKREVEKANIEVDKRLEVLKAL